jgi:hypothetical protein
MQDSAAKMVQDLDWDTFDESILVGDLNDVYGLVEEEGKSTTLRKLASITSAIKSLHR